MATWLETQITRHEQGSQQNTGSASSTVNRTTSGRPETVTQTQQPVTDESTRIGDQETETIRKVDAGITIVFSVPIRGGLYGDGNANPPL